LSVSVRCSALGAAASIGSLRLASGNGVPHVGQRPSGAWNTVPQKHATSNS
jgi:hypothetical protein